jgi:hypothetical protein
MFGPYQGVIEFQRLEGGAWIIGRWQLTTPAVVEEAAISSLEPVHTADWAAESSRQFQEWAGCAPTARNGDGNGAATATSGDGNGAATAASPSAPSRQECLERLRRNRR